MGRGDTFFANSTRERLPKFKIRFLNRFFAGGAGSRVGGEFRGPSGLGKGAPSRHGELLDAKSLQGVTTSKFSINQVLPPSFYCC
jgi:hypothetical protein